MWLFKQSTALYPSCYLKHSDNQTHNRNQVFGTLTEAKRVRDAVTTQARELPIYLYSRVRYRHTDDWYLKVTP